MKNKFSASFLAQSGLIAALYVVLTFAFAPISFGSVQLRIVEALTILPLFTPAAIPGLFVGCLVENILGGAILPDIIFGSLATLIGAALGYRLRENRWLVPVPAVVSNTVIVSLVLRYGYEVNVPIHVIAIIIFIGEVLGCVVLGELLATLLLRHGKRIFGK